MKKRNFLKIILLYLVICSFITNFYSISTADKIRLKNGDLITGKVISKDDKLTILRGNQRYKVLTDLGWEKVSCHMKIIVPVKMEPVMKAFVKFLPNAKYVSGQTPRLARTPKEWNTR